MRGEVARGAGDERVEGQQGQGEIVDPMAAGGERTAGGGLRVDLRQQGQAERVRLRGQPVQ
nr:hypothetical protein [Anaerolineae bacterium]